MSQKCIPSTVALAKPPLPTLPIIGAHLETLAVAAVVPRPAVNQVAPNCTRLAFRVAEEAPDAV